MKIQRTLLPLILPLVALSVSCASPGSSQRSTPVVGEISGFAASTDPSAIVRGFYGENDLGPFIWPDDAEYRSPQLSDHLSALFAAGIRSYGQFVLTFDPIVNGQDALIKDLTVHPAVIDGDRAYVSVRFRNFDEDNVLIYSFIRTAEAWQLDELASVGGEFRWLLSDVLQNP